MENRAKQKQHEPSCLRYFVARISLSFKGRSYVFGMTRYLLIKLIFCAGSSFLMNFLPVYAPQWVIKLYLLG